VRRWSVPRPSDRNATRARIIEEAARLVERFTVSKVTMDDIARAAGIARQTLYKYFASKDELLIELFVMRLTGEQHPELAKRLRKPPSVDLLLDLVWTELQLARDFPLASETLDPTVAPRMAELVFSSRKFFEHQELFWFPVLESFEEAGVLRPGLDYGAIVRWLTYQEFCLVTHPTVLSADEAEQRRYLADFVIPALVREDAQAGSPAKAASSGRRR